MTPDTTERDAQAWRMLEEMLEIREVADLDFLRHAEYTHPRIGSVLRAVHDALAYRRQT